MAMSVEGGRGGYFDPAGRELRIAKKKRHPSQARRPLRCFCSVDPITPQSRFHVGLNELIACNAGTVHAFQVRNVEFQQDLFENAVAELTIRAALRAA